MSRLIFIIGLCASALPAAAGWEDDCRYFPERDYCQPYQLESVDCLITVRSDDWESDHVGRSSIRVAREGFREGERILLTENYMERSFEIRGQYAPSFQDGMHRLSLTVVGTDNTPTQLDLDYYNVDYNSPCEAPEGMHCHVHPFKPYVNKKRDFLAHVSCNVTGKGWRYGE